MGLNVVYSDSGSLLLGNDRRHMIYRPHRGNPVMCIPDLAMRTERRRSRTIMSAPREHKIDNWLLKVEIGSTGHNDFGVPPSKFRRVSS